jgi:RNA polymerase sigma-70 factor (ECF subfamily)
LEAWETSALAALYDRHAGYALGIAQRILGDRAEAEEVVQDVFWQLWSSRLRYDERRGKFTTWLFTVARNRAVDRLRRRASRPTGEPDLMDGLAGHDDALGRVIEGERKRSVLAALEQLSPGQREAIELSFYRGLTHSEIAQETGEPLGTVKSRMSRALVALRDALGRSAGVA